MMDLNQLLLQQQIALMNTVFAGQGPAEGSRFDMVGYYSRRIRALKTELGVGHYPDWVRQAPGA
jgi:hypothetical protein